MIPDIMLVKAVLNLNVIKVFQSDDEYLFIPSRDREVLSTIENKYIMSKNDFAMKAKQWMYNRFYGKEVKSFTSCPKTRTYNANAVIEFYSNRKDVVSIKDSEAECIIDCCQWLLYNGENNMCESIS